MARLLRLHFVPCWAFRNIWLTITRPHARAYVWLSVHVLAQGVYVSVCVCVCFWCGADKPTCFADCCGSLIFSVQQEKGGHAIRHFHSISTSRNAAGTLLGLFVCYTPALGFYRRRTRQVQRRCRRFWMVFVWPLRRNRYCSSSLRDNSIFLSLSPLLYYGRCWGGGDS